VLNIINIFIFPSFDLVARYSRKDTRPVNSHDEKPDISEIGTELKSHVPPEDTYDGFRVKVEKLPEVKSVATNLQWSSFTAVEHRIDSSSCHIYTALWNGKPVILKLIKADRITSPVAVAEFETEANVLSRIRHPHIVRFLGSGYQPRRFLVLELLDGGSLSHALGVRVDKNQRSWRKHFSFLDALKLARAMAGALEYLHENWNDHMCIIHRDLKPDNIGFTADGHIKLFDFGLCSVVRKRKGANETYEMTGNTGTLRYMAPEVALGKEYNHSVDVYSFGIILWQIVKGKVPFNGLGRRTYMENVVIGGDRPKLDRSWNKQFIRLLRRCWCEDKSLRPTFTEIVSELDALILIEETSAKHRLINIIKNACIPSAERIICMRPYILSVTALFLFVSIVVALAKQSEIVGIAMTIVAAFVFYVSAISCIQGKTAGLLDSEDEVSVNAIQLGGVNGKKAKRPSMENSTYSDEEAGQMPPRAFNPMQMMGSKNVPQRIPSAAN